MKAILVALISFVACGEKQKSFAADYPRAQVATNGARGNSENEVVIRPSTASSGVTGTTRFVSEIVSVRYESAKVIADALNSLGTNPGGWQTSKVACKNKMNVLSNAWERLSESFRERNSLRERSRDVVNTGVDKIIADERTNSLLIYGSEDDLKILKETVARLDVVRTQILIEALIFEVSLSDPNQVHRHKKAANAAPKPSVINESNAVAFAPVAMTNEVSNRFVSVQGFKGDLDSLITEIANDSRVRILQRPRIQTSDGEPATIFVGESPYPSDGHYDGCVSSIQQLQTGVTLEVNPDVTSEGSMLLEIHQTVESENGSVNIANVGSVPITSRREFRAQVSLADRQTMLLGGLIQSGKVGNQKGIPVIGQLFGKSNQAEQKEMMVAIRPTTLPSPEHTVAPSNSD